MTIQANNSDLQDRLDFVGLDERQRRSLANVQPVIGTAIGHALDVFYTKNTRKQQNSSRTMPILPMPKSAKSNIGRLSPPASTRLTTSTG